MSNDHRAWLTPSAHERLTAELAVLTGAAEPSDAGKYGFLVSEDKDAREARITRIQELLRDAVIGEAPPDDGIAEPGMVLTVRYGEEAETATFVLGVRDRADSDGLAVYSPESPLGRALVGAVQGEERSYTLPNGKSARVTLVSATPYGAEAAHSAGG